MSKERPRLSEEELSASGALRGPGIHGKLDAGAYKRPGIPNKMLDGDTNGFSHFAELGTGKFLDFDPRPTFVLNAENINTRRGLDIVFSNQAFRDDKRLVGNLEKNGTLISRNGTSSEDSIWTFRAWAQYGEAAAADAGAQSWMGFNWTAFMIHDHWKVISGVPIKIKDAHTPDTPSSELARDLPIRQQNGAAKSASAGIELSPSITSRTMDWTVAHPDLVLSPHIILARKVDWAATPFGPMNHWTPEFRELANLVMYTPHAAALFWGEDLSMMYNESYAKDIAGTTHPNLMGIGFRGAFEESWELVREVFENSMRTGNPVTIRDQMLPLTRNGFIEETFFTWSLTPIYAGKSTLRGLYHPAFETTRQIINDRRTATLLQLGEEVALAKSVTEFWQKILNTLRKNEYDFPFALLYSLIDDTDVEVEEDTGSMSSSSSYSTKSCILEGTLGVPAGHTTAPTRIDLYRSRGGFIPVFREAMKTRKPTILDIDDGVLAGLIEGLEWRGFREPCRQAVVCPIRPTTSETVMGFLVIAVNPRRPYDDDYKDFISLLDRQLATSLASVTLYEEERNRGDAVAEAATLERFKLSQELAIHKDRLQRIAEISPIGMFSVDPEGMLLSANDRWYQMTGHERDRVYEMSWMDLVDESSRPTIEEAWKVITEDRMPWTGEVRLKCPHYDPVTGQQIPFWVLAEAQPEYTREGEIRTVMGSFTDITLQKKSTEDANTRARLSEELLIRTQEAKQNEKNFKRFSDLSPGGLVILDTDAKIKYANSQWFNISGHPRAHSGGLGALSWIGAILDEDLPLFKEKWDEMLTTRQAITMEVRMSNQWEGVVGGAKLTIPRWALCSISPEISENGEISTIMGCVTDISRIKWAEGLQNRRLAEAEETRRQQNSFIDITSHEMRNPLSAIVQSAEGISTLLKETCSSRTDIDPILVSSLKFCIEAAETIQLCAQHQKSIVDDILTISKVDSDLLAITPVPMQPIAAVKRALKIFTAEFQQNNIEHQFLVEDSYQALEVDTVMMDTSRLLQVLINLLTNAIKFTKAEKRRSVKVFLSAHRDIPPNDDSEFEYFPTRKIKSYVTIGDDWGKGEILYLRFRVEDTGCGLTNDEKKSLFTRFQQASPRTHVHYGGSGLGLFIARQLVELQGGEIGVASQRGAGSAFAFYVKVRRAEAETNEGSMEAQLTSDVQSSMNLQANTIIHDATSNDTVNGSLSDFLSIDDMVVPSSTMKGWHILIVEDNLVNQKVLATQIRKLGCTVYVANHGLEALDVLRSSKYYKGNESSGKDLSIILMDWEMPVMDGLSCARRIREMQCNGDITAHVPIIAVTANARGEQIIAAKASGMVCLSEISE